MKRTAGIWLPYTGILLATFSIHGLLLINDGTYWDDWLSVTVLRAKDWAWVWRGGVVRGEPLDAYFGWFFSFFQNLQLAYHLVAFLCILVSACLVYAICQQLGVLSRVESLWAALLSMAYPAFQTQILLGTTNYLFYFTLLLTATWLALKSERPETRHRIPLRIVALVLFFISFSLSSLLVLYAGFVALLILAARHWQVLSWREVFKHYLLGHADYLLLPFEFWFLKTTFFPAHELYKNYNQFNLTLSSITDNLLLFINNGILAQFRIAVLGLAHQPLLWPLAITIAFGGWMLFGRHGDPDRLAVTWYLLGGGLILLVLGVLPYIVAGLGPTVTGWNTRHSLLLGLPIALILVGLARVLSSRPLRRLAFPGWILLAGVLCAFGVSMVSTYIGWQARWVKDSSLMVNLSVTTGAGNYSIYWVSDEYPVGGESADQFYEYSSMFREVWGGQSRIGYPTHDIGIPKYISSHFTQGYNIRDFDPAGCQAWLKIRRGELGLSETSLAAHYLYYKFFQPERLPAFLANVTKIRIVPQISPLATDCKPWLPVGP